MRGDGGTRQLGASRCEGHRQGERGASTLLSLRVSSVR